MQCYIENEPQNILWDAGINVSLIDKKKFAVMVPRYSD